MCNFLCKYPNLNMLYYALLSLTLTLVSAKTFLPPSTPPLGWHVNKNNQYPTSTELIQFTLSLKETNQNKLEAIALEVSTPTHKSYGNFLTANEIDALTEPEPDTLQNVLLWLKKYNPEVLSAPDDMKKAIFEAGNVVGGLACALFPGGKEVEYTKDYEQMIRQTKEFMSEGVKDIFEATFQYDNILVMVDILHQNEDGSYEIYEVKSSTWNNIESTSEQKKKLENYIQDASIQYYVLNGLGLNINEIFITLLSKNYIRKESLDIKKLFHSERVTGKIIELVNDDVKEFKIIQMISTLTTHH